MSYNTPRSVPSSARSQSRFNPITGEETVYTPRQDQQHTYTTPQSRPHSRPDGVPALELGRLGAGYDEPDRGIPLELDPYKFKLTSPNTASTISWGTPTSAYSKRNHRQDAQQTGTGRRGIQEPHIQEVQKTMVKPTTPQKPHKQPVKTKQQTAWDQPPVPENVPPPSERQRQQFEQYQKELKQSYKKHVGGVTEEDVVKDIERLKNAVPQIPGDEESEEVDKAWTQQPYSKPQQLKKMDRELLEEEKKKLKMLETVMIDQLSRAAISDPEQNLVSQRPVGSQYPCPQRGSVRTLHDSKVKTSGSATENVLSKRLRFDARVLTSVGRDAIRELSGFFFAVDNSLTVYEFKQFGKSAKALPFIKRGLYHHISGSRKGQPYTLTDIMQGSDLEFETVGQPLPETMQEKSVALLRVANVDDESKAAILLSGVPNSKKDEVWTKAHLPQSVDDLKEALLRQQVHQCVRKQIEKRGIKVMTGLQKHFKKLDETGDGVLNKYDLEKALIDFHIDILQENFDDLWEILDKDCSSFMHYEEFMRGFLGEMNENRKLLVRKAFLKMDTSKQGTLSLDAITKFYNTYAHPRVVSGECTEEEVLRHFLSSFEDPRQACREVSFTEIEAYYEGVSVGVENDEDFVNILKNTWGV